MRMLYHSSKRRHCTEILAKAQSLQTARDWAAKVWSILKQLLLLETKQGKYEIVHLLL